MVDKPVDSACQNKVQNENFAALSKGTRSTQTVTSNIHTHACYAKFMAKENRANVLIMPFFILISISDD